MGLDITAYRRITKLDVVFDADGEPLNPATREPIEGDYFQAFVNDDFGPERYAGIEHKAIYAYEDAHGFHAGSYGGYNKWREKLAKLAGYPTTPFERVEGYPPSQVDSHAASAWAGKCEGKPFVELVNFADNEGVLCAAVCAKLARDFAEFDDRAKALDDEWFYGKYCEWRKAMEMAAEGGCVDFH